MSDRYRGRTTRQRNVAEKVAREWAERRAAAEAREAGGRPRPRRRRRRRSSCSIRRRGRRATARRRPPRRVAARPAAARRGPRRVAVARRRPSRPGPRGAAAPAPRHRLVRRRSASASGRVAAPGMHGRHVGLTVVPHGAKSYLAAALALAPAGERVCWVARDAEIGDRVAEELGAWLGDPALVAVLEPRTSLAYERSELVPDETAARVAALAAWRAGTAKVLVASVQALLQATLAPVGPARASSRDPEAGDPDRAGRAPRRAPRPRLRAGARGRRPGRVRAPRAASSTCSRRRASLPVRIEFFGDEIDSPAGLRPDRPAERRHGEGARAPARDGVPAPARRRGRDPGAARPAGVAGCPSASPWTSRGSPARRRHPSARRAATEGRALAAGDAAEVWSRLVAPSTGLDHLDPAHAVRPRRAGRPRRGRRVPVAAGRGAPPRARRGGRPAQGLAGRLPPAARLEGAPPRRADPRAHLAVATPQEAAGDGVRLEGPDLGRPVRLARARPAAGPDRAARRRRRALAGRAAARRPRLATRRRASRSCSARPATRSGS